MMVMEHVLLGFKIMMMYVIDDVPRWIREAIAQRNALQRAASSNERISKYAAGESELSSQSASPRSRTARRTSTATAAFLHSLTGKTQKSNVRHAAEVTAGLPPTSGATTIIPGKASLSPLSSSERDDVSVLTETSEKPFLRQRASNFLHHLTGRPSKPAHSHSATLDAPVKQSLSPGVAA